MISIMKKRISFLPLAMIVLATMCGGSVKAMTEEAQNFYTNYEQIFQVYSQQAAQMERDKQIYARAANEENLNSLLVSARAALTSRQEVMVNYSSYLAAVCSEYMKNQIELARLREDLVKQTTAFSALDNNFTQLVTWRTADNNFAKTMATFQVTAYQTYAWIYWTRLNLLANNFVDLVTAQKERILAEASSEIIRTQKEKTLAETERTLVKLQKRIEESKATLTKINSDTTYNSFAHTLDQIQTDLQATAQTYAELE